MELSEQFHKEVERILKQVYSEPIKEIESIVKRAIITCEFRYVEYLSEKGLVKRLDSVKGGGMFGIQLTNEGHKVFENYSGWKDYYKKVILKSEKQFNYKYLAEKYWWVTIVISFLALAVAILK